MKTDPNVKLVMLKVTELRHTGLGVKLLTTLYVHVPYNIVQSLFSNFKLRGSEKKCDLLRNIISQPSSTTG